MTYEEAKKENPDLDFGAWKWGANYEDYDEDYE